MLREQVQVEILRFSQPCSGVLRCAVQ